MGNIKLSIVVPIYKVENYLKDALDSIVSSIKDNEYVEVLCIDDGSPDNSWMICEEFAKKYNYIRIYQRDNSGVSDTRNYGILNAKGKYICFMDSDDYMHEDYIRNIFDLIDNDFDLCFFEYEDLPQQENGFKKIVSSRNSIFNEINTGEEVLSRMMSSNVYLSNVWSCVYSRDFLIKNNLFFSKKFKSSEDVDFIISCLSKANKVLYTNDISIIYRRYRDNSASNTISIENLLSDLEVRIKWHDYAVLYLENKHYFANQIIEFIIANKFNGSDLILLLEWIEKNKRFIKYSNSKKGRLYRLIVPLLGDKKTIDILKVITT